MDNSNIAVSEESNCPYCKALETVGDAEEGNCPYCVRDEDLAADSLANCQYCADSAAECKYCDRPAASEQTSNAGECQYCATSAHRENECQYCGNGPTTVLPTTTNSQDYAGQDLDAPAIMKPMPGDQPPMEVAPQSDVPSNNNLNLDGQGEVTVASDQPRESVQVDHSKEALMNIAQQIEGAPSPVDAAKEVDSTQLAVGTTMEDNISRPAGYEENIPGDMGLGEASQEDSSPDLTSVLNEGLDSHANNIQREKVVQMAFQALQGFKSCKVILERSQQQAPQLYNASILMLKAMIEMAKMLGLDKEGAPAASGNPLEDPAKPQGEWDNPFPVHPENGGDAVPGSAPGIGSASNNGDANNSVSNWNNPFPKHPENGGEDKAGIGQGVGKLPTSATTEHVAKQPIIPGSVNAQGQMRYVDPNTEKESFINMKEGRVLSPTGKPVKPSQG